MYVNIYYIYKYYLVDSERNIILQLHLKNNSKQSYVNTDYNVIRDVKTLLYSIICVYVFSGIPYVYTEKNRKCCSCQFFPYNLFKERKF